MTTAMLILGAIGVGMILAGCLMEHEACQPAKEKTEMQCMIYTRFSPRRNAATSQSCETQEALCREYALKEGWEVGEVYADKDKSGSDANRPGLISAIAALKRGDVLLVYKRDRIARKVLLAELTRRQVSVAGATIVAVSGDVAGNDKDPTVVFVRQIMDSVAELERKQIAARTRDSMREHQRNGRRVSYQTPYGTKPDPNDPTKLKFLESEMVAVRRARELESQGLSAGAIHRILNNEMPGAARAGKWNRNAVVRLLKRQEMKV